MTETSSDVAFLVVSCDRYSDLWRPYFQCLFKYWPDCQYPVYLGSNKKSYPDPRVKTLAIGADRDYSSNLLAMLDAIPQEWVIATVEDHFISKAVDTARIRRIVAALQKENAGYAKLIGEYPISYDEGPVPEMGEIPKGVRYRISFTVALWNKKFLLKILRSGETAWDIERKGAVRSDDFAEKLYAVVDRSRRDPPIVTFHGIIQGKQVRALPGFLRQEGIDPAALQRSFLPLQKEIYVKLYILWLLAHIYTKKYWMRNSR